MKYIAILSQEKGKIAMHFIFYAQKQHSVMFGLTIGLAVAVRLTGREER